MLQQAQRYMWKALHKTILGKDVLEPAPAIEDDEDAP